MKYSQVEIICVQCGNPFRVHKYRKDIARFCSRACYHKWRKGFVSHSVDVPAKDIAKRYLAGESATALAKAYSVSIWTICNRLEKEGIKRRAPTGENLHDPATQESARIANKQRVGKQHPAYIDVPSKEIARRYREGESMQQLAHAYDVSTGVIVNRLKGLGVKSRRQGFSRRRRCPDGHIVDSRWEYAVDRWLDEHEMEHEVHPYVPWYNGGKSPQRSDFLVAGTYIEVWGVIGNETYNRKRRSKIENYKKCGAPLIELFPHHILDGDMAPLLALL